MITIWNKIKTWWSNTWDWFTALFSSKKMEITEKVSNDLAEKKVKVKAKLETEEERLKRLLNKKMVKALKMIDEATEDLDGKIDVYRRTKMKHLISKFKENPEQIDRIMLREFGRVVEISEEE